MVNCTICDAGLNLSEDVEVNEIIMCEECGAELEVRSINPPEIQEAPQVEEDWGE
ncbi:MAG: lysine biosynthesis protein LysW [Candidatus Thermoplasmatota archaeon]